MKLNFKPINEQVIVITGASSGIGLATARAAAAQGAQVVLASRNEDVLKEIEQEIKARGGDALHVVADVGKRKDVQRIADAAIDRFGHIDTWVNNAGHTIYGRLEEVSDEDSERLFLTNFWGVVHGSRVALPHLKTRGGVLINLGSVAADQALPMQGMYSASKHAVKGFTDALRMELEAEGAPVSVTLIKPTGINTPYTQHARNYMRQEPKLPPPVYAPEEVAQAILYAATHHKRDIYIGSGAKFTSLLGRAAPRVMDRVAGPIILEEQRRHEPPRDPAGSLHQAGVDGRVHGDHPGYVMKRSFYTRSTLHPMVTGALVAAGVAAAAWMTRAPSEPRSGPRERQGQ